MPQLSLVASKLHIMQVEKEEVTSQLKEATSEISILQAKNKALENMDIKSKGTAYWNILTMSSQTRKQLMLL